MDVERGGLFLAYGGTMTTRIDAIIPFNLHRMFQIHRLTYLPRLLAQNSKNKFNPNASPDIFFAANSSQFDYSIYTTAATSETPLSSHPCQPSRLPPMASYSQTPTGYSLHPYSHSFATPPSPLCLRTGKGLLSTLRLEASPGRTLINGRIVQSQEFADLSSYIAPGMEMDECEDGLQGLMDAYERAKENGGKVGMMAGDGWGLEVEVELRPVVRRRMTSRRSVNVNQRSNVMDLEAETNVEVAVVAAHMDSGRKSLRDYDDATASATFESTMPIENENENENNVTSLSSMDVVDLETLESPLAESPSPSPSPSKRGLDLISSGLRARRVSERPRDLTGKFSLARKTPLQMIAAEKPSSVRGRSIHDSRKALSTKEEEKGDTQAWLGGRGSKGTGTTLQTSVNLGGSRVSKILLGPSGIKRKTMTQLPITKPSSKEKTANQQDSRGRLIVPKQKMQVIQPEGLSAMTNPQKPMACAHCGTTENTVWRIKHGQKVCNACGLYWNANKRMRPSELFGGQGKGRPKTKKPRGKRGQTIDSDAVEPESEIAISNEVGENHVATPKPDPNMLVPVPRISLAPPLPKRLRPTLSNVAEQTSGSSAFKRTLSTIAEQRHEQYVEKQQFRRGPFIKTESESSVELGDDYSETKNVIPSSNNPLSDISNIAAVSSGLSSSFTPRSSTLPLSSLGLRPVTAFTGVVVPSSTSPLATVLTRPSQNSLQTALQAICPDDEPALALKRLLNERGRESATMDLPLSDDGTRNSPSKKTEDSKMDITGWMENDPDLAALFNVHQNDQDAPLNPSASQETLKDVPVTTDLSELELGGFGMPTVSTYDLSNLDVDPFVFYDASSTKMDHQAASVQSSPQGTPFDFSQLPPSSPPIQTLGHSQLLASSPGMSSIDYTPRSEYDISPQKPQRPSKQSMEEPSMNDFTNDELALFIEIS